MMGAPGDGPARARPADAPARAQPARGAAKNASGSLSSAGGGGAIRKSEPIGFVPGGGLFDAYGATLPSDTEWVEASVRAQPGWRARHITMVRSAQRAALVALHKAFADLPQNATWREADGFCYGILTTPPEVATHEQADGSTAQSRGVSASWCKFAHAMALRYATLAPPLFGTVSDAPHWQDAVTDAAAAGAGQQQAANFLAQHSSLVDAPPGLAGARATPWPLNQQAQAATQGAQAATHGAQGTQAAAPAQRAAPRAQAAASPLASAFAASTLAASAPQTPMSFETRREPGGAGLQAGSKPLGPHLRMLHKYANKCTTVAELQQPVSHQLTLHPTQHTTIPGTNEVIET